MMRIKKYSMDFAKAVLLFVLAAGFLSAGKAVPVRAVEKVALTTDIFKDENLLKALKRYDQDGNGYLSKGEIASIEDLSIDESVADISGVEYLTNLESVTMIYEGTSAKFGKNVISVQLRMKAPSIKIDAPGAMYVQIYSYRDGNEELECKAVDVSKCKNLKELYLWAHGMTSFQLPKDGGKINSIRIGYSAIKRLKLPTTKKLNYLSVCWNDQLISIDSNNAPNLETLKIFDNPSLEVLSFHKNSNLDRLICGNTAVKKLNISNNKKLTFLSCPNNKLTGLDCSKNEKLTALQCYNNKLTSLKVKKAPMLKEVSCEKNMLKTLDLSNYRKLNVVKCYDNPLNSLYVKNKTNILQKVSIAPVITSVKISEPEKSYNLAKITVQLKEDKKIKDYYLSIVSEENQSHAYQKNQSKSIFEWDVYNQGTYIIKAVGGVTYKGTMIYAEETIYKDKVLIDRDRRTEL